MVNMIDHAENQNFWDILGEKNTIHFNHARKQWQFVSLHLHLQITGQQKCLVFNIRPILNNIVQLHLPLA